MKGCRVWFSLHDIVSRQCVVRTLTPRANSALGCWITVVPMIHVARKAFYDEILNIVSHGLPQVDKRLSPKCSGTDRGATIVLMEGLLDDEAARQHQQLEYDEVASCDVLRSRVRGAALSNTLYTHQTQQAMCEEMHVSWERLRELDSEECRLQDCYFRPLVATLGSEFRVRNSDVTMAEAIAAVHSSGGDSTEMSLVSLGRHDAVKNLRERSCAKMALDVAHQGACRVVVPWGFYHADGIVENIQRVSEGEYVIDTSMEVRISYGLSAGVVASWRS